MPRSLRSNSTAPDIRPFVNPQPRPVIRNVRTANMAAVVPPTAPSVIWSENPLPGDFNPGTPSGQKIFLEKVKGPPEDKRVPLMNSRSAEIMAHLKVKEQVMGKVITHIPTTYTGGIAGDFINLVHQSPSITMERVQREAHRRFGTVIDEADPIPALPWIARDLTPATVDDDKKTFYSRVHGNVVAEVLKNLLTPAGWDDLMLQKSKFTFTTTDGNESHDGPTMLKVLLEEIDPTSSVNIELHRQAIEGSKLHNFKGNVVEMLKDIEKHHQAIVSNGHSYDPDTYRRHLLAALLSGPNAVFNSKLEGIKSDVDACYGFNAKITPGELITVAKQQYVNIDRRGEWNKVDPKDATILALTTALKDVGTKQPAQSSTEEVGDHENVKGMRLLKKWRTVFKGDTIVKDGVTHTWCPHHKNEGYYDGLYYHNHTPATHDQWREGKKNWKKNKDNGNDTSRATSGAQKSLKISDALKTALCTNLCISEEDLAKIVDSTDQEN